MIGQTVSHYKIIEKLGEGGMGVVYKALDTTLDRPVSLKFLPRYLTSDANEKERFYHEARAASALNHPNITTIYEITEFEQQLYLAMEFVEGKTLKKLIEQEEVSLRKVFDIAIQICEGLAAAAEQSHHAEDHHPTCSSPPHTPHHAPCRRCHRVLEILEAARQYSRRGDHAGDVSSPRPVVNSRCMRPSRSVITNTRSPPRRAEKTRYRPSGAHDGSSFTPSRVTYRPPVPSAPVTTI